MEIKYGKVDNELLQATDLVYQDKAKNADQDPNTNGVISVEIAKKMKQENSLQDKPEDLKAIRESNPQLGKYYFDASEIKEAFKWMLDSYYENYKAKTGKEIPEELKYIIDVNEKYSSIDVRDKSSMGSVICIPAKRIVDGVTLINLLSHEIEGHVRQSINGSLVFKVGGGVLKIDDEVLYEGLAKDNEDKVNKELFGKDSKTPDPYYVMAIDLAQKGKSFNQIFREIKEKFSQTAELQKKDAGVRERESDNRAWMITYRVFRGHINTANKEGYAMTKDISYLKGWLLQKQLKEAGLGHLNESAIAQEGALKLLNRFDFLEADLPLPNLNKTIEYCKEVMIKRFEVDSDS